MGRYAVHVLIALAMLGCGEGDGAEGAEVADAALDGPDAADQGDPCHDTDGDGISDSLERNLEHQFHPDDGDDVPAESDLDSDGDGYSDAEERGDVPDACFPPADLEGDFVPDFLDQDSDGDGVPDAEEAEHGFDRTSPDTDRDGCPDPAELELDGCSDPRQMVLFLSCVQAVGHATFTWDGPGVLSEASLVIDYEIPAGPLEVRAAAVVPAGHAEIDHDRFFDVQPGAAITFSAMPTEFEAPPPGRLGELRLLSGDGEVLDTGAVYVYGDGACDFILI